MKKIAIPTDNNVSISDNFGKARWFKIISVEENHLETLDYIENKTHAYDPESRQSYEAIMSALKDCEVIITRNMGKGIQEELQSVNKKVIFTKEIQMDAAVDSFIRGSQTKK